jgi:N-acetylglucosamine repressor
MRKIDTHRFVRATRGTPRTINRQIILNLVREHHPISRADLARRMHVGRGMVTSLVGDLIAAGAIYEGDAVDAPRGRRPKMLHIRTHDRLAVAIDVRFSQTFVMVTDLAGHPIHREVFDTIVDPTALVRHLARRIPSLLQRHSNAGSCNGIGIVVPGMVDHASGRVLYAPQLGWRDVDIRGALSDATGLAVHIENAPIACALAQLWLAQRGAEVPRNFVYVTVSDGVGAGVVVNGEVLRGHAYTAGEFGHVPLDPRGPRCLCGARGCLEVYTSNLATLSRYLGHTFSADHTRDLLLESGLTIDDVIARARTGDERARSALLATGRALGRGLATIVNTLNPARIYVGGEITDVWPALEKSIRAELERRALTPSAAATPIVAEPAGDYPRLRGATALVTAPLFAAPQVA